MEGRQLILNLYTCIARTGPWDDTQNVTLCRCARQAKQLKHGVPIVADLTKEEDLKRAVVEAIEKLGGLDILINK